jgi:hypothetical protein
MNNVHEIRDRERHFQNTWEWDKWGFTSEWDAGCTLSDIDGFYPHFAEISGKFLIVEVKHWDGSLPLPEPPMHTGQAKALLALSKQPNFTIIWAYGNTATRTIDGYQVWYNGERYDRQETFKEFLTGWFKWARSN